MNLYTTGQGGGTQIQFKSSIDFYEKLGFLKEVKNERYIRF